MNDLPYQAEYAKSGKSTCRDCKQKIDNGALRIAVMIQSVIFDGKQPFWHHQDCFFNKFHPATFNDIANFNQLRNADQKMIKTKIVSFNKVVMPDEPDAGVKVESKAEKRAVDSGDFQALSDYRVDYAKSARVTCNNCKNKILKDEIRIKKIVYDTEAGCKYGGQALWHHVSCFAEKRSDLMYFAGGENLPGFEELKEDDQKLIKETIMPFKLDEIPLKKLKEETNDSDDMKDDKQKATLIMRQNMSFQRFKKVLSDVKKKDIQEMLDLNAQTLTTGPDERLNHLADCMTFGALSPCPECEQGQLVLESFGYKCTGNLSAWTKCSYVTQEPKRQLLKLTTAFKTGYSSALKNYKPKTGLRLFLSAPKPVVVLKEEPYASTKSDPPLKNFEFFLFGILKKQDETKERILQLGGVLVTKLSDTVVAVISTKNDVGKMTPEMKEIKKLNLVVVEDTFLDSIDQKGTITDSLQIIKENNIADWGADPASRIPPEMLKPKPGSRFESINSGQVKLNIQGGTIVDPDSGLAAVAHVYKDSDGTKYTVVLTQTDIVAQKNSYYKMQVLEGNNGQFYWLFRSWGRIGTSIGHHKSDQVKSAKEAVEKFEALYEEKTKNSWQRRNNFIKVPGRYYPLDIDYSKTGDDAEIILEVDANSKLPVSVQKLVIKFFDVKHMKKIMLEFELDTEKMLLGKISKNQIDSGYKVLSELLNLIENGNSSQNEIVDATNRFFTLIPHDFGIQNAPLLNNVDIIKAKTEMLHNLLEIETAYSLLKLDGDKSKGVIDAHFLKLKCDMAPIPKEAPEYKLISEYLRNTHGYTHKYKLKIEEVFKVVREDEEKKYLPFKKLHNRRLLWHGSRITNFAGILSQGLRIAPPEAPVAGDMFGKGIYFADMVTKSANYCCTSSSNPVGVMLLCEVALGTMRECYRAEQVQLQPHEHSAWGVGRTQPDPKQNRIIDDQVIVPLGKPVNNPSPPYKCVEYNEFIVYNVAQVNVKYLLQCKKIC